MKLKSQNSSKEKLFQNKAYLVNKITEAMKMKYSIVFKEAKYDEKSLHSDINKLVTTQYYSWNPKDLFTPIETDVLEIIKKKNPKIKIRIKKARKLSPIKYLYNKYQEADIETENNQKKNVSSENKNSLQPKNSKSNKYIITNINTQKNSQNKNIISKSSTKSKSYEKFIFKPYYQNIKPSIQKENEQPHELRDKLNYIIQNDCGAAMIEEDQKLYKEEKEREKNIEINKKNQVKKFLTIQINENNKKRENERIQKLLERKELEEIVKKQNEEDKNKKDIKKKNLIIMRNLTEKKLNEKKKLIEEQKQKEKEEEKKIIDQNNYEPSYEYETKQFLERRQKIREGVLKEMAKKEKNYSYNCLKTINVDDDRINTYDFSNNSKEYEKIYEKVSQRQKLQERAGEFLKKIQSLKKNLESERNSIDYEKQKKMECEEADKKRINKLYNMKKSFDYCMINKNVKKRKEKMKINKLKDEIKENYDKYLKEEKDKKLEKIERYEKYRKDLEKQIKEKNARELEKLITKTCNY